MYSLEIAVARVLFLNPNKPPKDSSKKYSPVKPVPIKNKNLTALELSFFRK